MAATIALNHFDTEAMPHMNDLYRTASRLTRNPIDAEDLVQEVFMQAWKSFEQYQPGTNCKAWLYKILFNKLDHYRRKLYTQSKYIQEADELVYNNAVFTPATPEHLTDEEVIAAVDQLPGHYREVILLTDVHDFSYKETAEILNVPIGTVMSRLNRARKQLKKTLAPVAREFGINVNRFDEAFAA
jgi:RNA polymerase sigma-70 factor (ECF subfamily)